MQKRTLAVLAVLFGGLLAYVLLVEVGQEEERETREAREEQVLPIEVEDVNRVTLDGDHGKVTIERRDDGADGEWFLIEPYEAPADPAGARAIARAAATLQEQRTLEQPSEDRSQYGLDTPALRLTLEADGLEAPVTLIFGGETGTKDGRYLQVEGDDAIRIAPSHQVRSLDKGVDDLRDRRLVRFSRGSATRVTLSAGLDPLTIERVDGVWRLTGELPYRAARAEVEDLLAELTTTRVKRFVDADDPELGLIGSERWIEVELDDGEIVRVDFGRQDTDTVVAQVRGADEAAELGAFVTRALDRSAEGWRSRELADINPWSVTELRFRFRERSFTLLRDGEDDDAWTLADGDAAPVDLEASWARELLAAIDRTKVIDFFEPGSDPGPEVGDFELVTEGQPLVRFTLHNDGAAWVARVEGDPVPLGIGEELVESLDAFVADPLGTEG
jgi:hypothetical protein